MSEDLPETPSGVDSPAPDEASGAHPEETEARRLTARLIVVGDEILRGQTTDKNTGLIGRFLATRGIALVEAAFVPDQPEPICETVRRFKTRSTYVFMTGGLGPTHDDVTAAALADCLRRPLERNPEVSARLAQFYAAKNMPFTPARQKMAFFPRGASLLENPLTPAPGFAVENLFVLAGIPAIVEASLPLVPLAAVGPPLVSRSGVSSLPEGSLAPILEAAQKAHADVQIGCYPALTKDQLGPRVVLVSSSPAALRRAFVSLCREVEEKGGSLQETDPQ